MAPPTILILGSSARAWACSTRRAGFTVRAVDLFADRDLGAIAAATAVAPEEYPAGLAAVAARLPEGPWCYTGALENHPDLVDRIAASRPLAGCGAEVLRRVRCPASLAAALGAAAIAFPEWRAVPDGLPTDGSWLSKPVASAGGRGIAPWEGGHLGPSPRAGERIWQRRVEGDAVSAWFVVGAHGARLVGSSRQLLGVAAWHAPAFAWCGAIDVAPDDLADGVRRQWERVGAMLHGALGVQGAVGVDAVEEPGGRLVVIEVNPRPTASMELVDRRTGGSLAGEHLAAHGIVAVGPGHHGGGTCTWGKAVLRTPRPLAVDERFNAALDALSAAWSADDGADAVADLPRAATTVPAGAPLVTLFAVGHDTSDVRRHLDDRAGALLRLVDAVSAAC